MAPRMNIRFIDALMPAFRQGDANVDAKTEEANNILRLAKLYHAIAYHDFDALGELLTTDAVLEIIGAAGVPFVGHHEGREQVVEAARRNFSSVEEQHPEILTVVAQGNTVIVVGRERGRFHQTGKGYELTWMQEFRFNGDGAVEYIRELFDTATLMKVAERHN